MELPWAILALDLATCSGWVEGDGSAIPAHGYLELPPAVEGDRGPMFSAARAFLVRRIDRLQAKGYRVVVAFEQPILPKAFIKWVNGKPMIIYPTTIEATLVLQGLVAIAEQVADEMGCDCGHADVSTVKKALAGFGGADKDDMVFVAEKVGLTVERHDTADAFGVWLAALRHYHKRFSEDWDRRIWSSRGALL